MLLAALAVFWKRMLVLVWVDSVERLGGLVPPNHVFPCSFAVLKNIKLQMETTEELMSHQWDILVVRSRPLGRRGASVGPVKIVPNLTC